MKKLRVRLGMWLIAALLPIGLLPGCAGETVVSSELPAGTFPLADLLNLDSASITEISLAQGDLPPIADLTEPAQIKEACAFLASVSVEPLDREMRFSEMNWSGGWGDYQLSLTYADGSEGVVEFYADAKEVWLSGRTKTGLLEEKYDIYPLAAFPETEAQALFSASVSSAA